MWTSEFQNEFIYQYGQLRSTWNSTPARGPCKSKAAKSFDETVTTSAAFAHLDDRREKDIPLIQSSDGLVLVKTTCQNLAK